LGAARSPFPTALTMGDPVHTTNDDEADNEARAEALYWAAEKRLDIAYEELGNAAEPGRRAQLLFAMSAAATAMADLHTKAFGPDPLRNEGGRDLAESWKWVAEMYYLLGDVEAAVAHPIARTCKDSELEPYAGAVLDRMATTTDLVGRMRLLDPLIDALLDKCGGQAVESLWCLPAPGMKGPLTLSEREAWLDRRVFPRMPLAAMIFGVVVGGAMVFAGLGDRLWALAALGAVMALSSVVWYVKRGVTRRRVLAELGG
jgi:hypothetical protein